MQNNWVCSKHNYKIQYVAENQHHSTDRYLCAICISELNKNLSLVEDVISQQNEIFSQEMRFYQKNHEILENLITQIHSYKENMVNLLSKLIQGVQQSIEQTKFYQQVLSGSNQNVLSKKIFEQEANNLRTQYQQMVDQLMKQVVRLQDTLQQNTLTEYLCQIQFNLGASQDNSTKCMNLSSIQTSKIQQGEKKSQYQEIQRINYQNQDQYCKAIAFNNDGSKMIVSCGNQIDVYQISGEMQEKIQTIYCHEKDINCLYFMKNSNEFISASSDYTLQVFQLYYSNSFQPIQVLQGHSDSVLSIIMNKNEDTLITGGYDKNLKFWAKQDKWNCQQTIKCEFFIVGQSLNETGNKLIICGFDADYIMLIEKQQEQWEIVQKIQVVKYGYRLCFLDDNNFIFLPEASDEIQLFKDQEQINNYQIEGKICIENTNCDIFYFPIHFIQETNLIICKNCQNITIIQKSINGELKILQDFKYETNKVFGGVSGDGKFWASWDLISKEIKIFTLYQTI